MKRTLIYFLAISISLLFTNINLVKSQITLQHTFQGNVNQQNIVVPKTDYFIESLSATQQVKLYNSNFSLYKTININIPTNYMLAGCGNLSQGLVTQDGKIIFFVTMYSFTDGIKYILRMYNEDGVIIKDFGIHTGSIYYNFIKLGDDFKLWVQFLDLKTEIYSLPGTTQINIISPNDNTEISPYPNPTDNYLIVPYTKGVRLEVYNFLGQHIDTRSLQSNEQKIVLNTDSYLQGNYVYKIVGNNNEIIHTDKFVVRR